MNSLRQVAACLAALLVAGAPALAYAGGGVFPNPIEAESIVQLLAMLLKFFVRVATVVCVLFLIWSGFLFVKAQGNPEELEKAKRAFFYAVIGTILMLGAEVIAEALRRTIESLG